MGMTLEEEKGIGGSADHRFLSLSPPLDHDSSPTSYIIRAWWMPPTGYGADLKSPPPPASWGPLLAGGVRPSRLMHWKAPWPRWFHPGDVHFSQDHCHSPILYPMAMQCNGLNGPKRL